MQIWRDEQDKVWRQSMPDQPVSPTKVKWVKGPIVWKTEDGRHMLLTDMETTHLRNCLAQMLLRANGWRAGYLAPMVEELKKRDD